jgi:hypothetical protein
MTSKKRCDDDKTIIIRGNPGTINRYTVWVDGVQRHGDYKKIDDNEIYERFTLIE